MTIKETVTATCQEVLGPRNLSIKNGSQQKVYVKYNKEKRKGQP